MPSSGIPAASAARASSSSKRSSAARSGRAARARGRRRRRGRGRARRRGRCRRGGRAASPSRRAAAAARRARRRPARSPACRSARAPSRAAAARRDGAASQGSPRRTSEVVTPMSGRIEGQCRSYERLSSTAECPANTSSRCTSCPGRIRPDKQVLKDISLSFMPGAKIGVLGLNGSGKSTLLRIMAGRDTEYRGEAQLAPGATRRAARAGAPARREQGRARQRRGGRGGDPCAARPLQRARRQLLRRDRGRVRAHPGADRRRRRLEPGHAARHRHGRAASAPVRRRRNQACRAASAAAWRCAGCC